MDVQKNQLNSSSIHFLTDHSLESMVCSTSSMTYFFDMTSLFSGTAYGKGAYFSAKASYSNKYATASTLEGEHYMFVAYV